MPDAELAGLLAAHEAQAVGYYTSEIADQQARAIDYYYGRPFGDEQAGRSQVVDRTVAIVVDNAVAAVLKPFVSADDTVSFEPRGQEDEEQAEQATEYVNYVLHSDNCGFLILHDWFKSAMLEKLGIVKCWWEDLSSTERHMIEGLDAITLQEIMAKEKVVEGPFDDDGMFAVTVEREKADGRIKIVNVPAEEFLIAPYARDIETSPYVAHRPTDTTRSMLVEMGFDADVVDDLPSSSSDVAGDPRSPSRYQDEEFASSRSPNGSGNDKSQDLIAIVDEYVLVDFDGDGVSERRRVIRVDDVILYNKECADNPFALLCPVPMPHKVYGLSLADQVMDLQRISSVLWRQTLDNLYLSNNPKMELPEAAERQDGSTMDDLQDEAPGGVVRTRQGAMLNPIAIPFVADKSFPMLEYAEKQQEARTGIRRNGQGMDRDSLKKGGQITATQASQMENAANVRAEMIARIFAETGVKRLFKLMLRLLVEHQPRERMIRLRNKWVAVDPRGWNADMDLSISVGLGVGTEQERIAQADGVLATMGELAQTPYGALIGPTQVYNALKRKFVASGLKNVDDYLIEPPEDAQTPEAPDPAAMKAKADVEMQQAKLQMDQQRSQAELQQSQAESAAKLELMREEAAAKLDLERGKATEEAQLAREKAAFEMQMAREQMAFEADMARQTADRQHEVAMKQADAKISQNRPGGDLDK